MLDAYRQWPGRATAGTSNVKLTGPCEGLKPNPGVNCLDSYHMAVLYVNPSRARLRPSERNDSSVQEF